MGDTAQMEKVAEARAVFERDVYAPRFAEKCAELGAPLPDDESLHAALDTVRHIKSAAEKQSSSLAQSANSDLMAALGLERPEEKAAAEKATEEATKDAKTEQLQTAFQTLSAAAATEAAE